MHINPNLLTSKEAAAYLGLVSHRSMTTIQKKYDIKPITLCRGRWKWHKEDLDKLIDQQRLKNNPTPTRNQTRGHGSHTKLQITRTTP